MSSLPNLKRWCAFAITAAIFLAVMLIAGLGGPSKSQVAAETQGGKADGKSALEHVMFGGTPSRNMVNTLAKDVPVTWSIEEGSKDIKWTADLGSKAYGGPIIAGGKVFVGTNNAKPRDKQYLKDGRP